MAENGLAIRDDMSPSQLGKVFVESGFFSDTHQASQAIVKVLAGRELGFGPIASMTGVYVIQGRISMSANLLAAAIKRSGKYNFFVKQMTDEVCEIEYREKIEGKWESIGNSKFTISDAKRAQTKNMDKYPRNMLYARAMSNGARWYCPDIFGGPVYTPEELGANVNEEGEIIDLQAVATADPTYEEVFGEPKLAPAVRPEVVKSGGQPDPVNAELVYTGDPGTLAKFGKHNYPREWAKALMTNADFADDKFHVDSILQKLRLPQEYTPEQVIDAIENYIAGAK